ncbi:MAG TPA: hypothetical protein ENH60_09560 [Pricia sp.]|uniref:Uncharacterized protein n=1 Tax=Pricia antarctica TaxID=641691 RepID=A0A831QRY3_9FLAO|nr:hypothetical protein [Pricia sp.]HEA21998.1 hypothetical protein [Pricia antarctica]
MVNRHSFTFEGGLNVLYGKAQRRGKCINFGVLSVHFRFGDGWCVGETDVPERSVEKLFALAGTEGVVKNGDGRSSSGL